ncbi:MAPEG family protein [Roseobacter sinensis]|uniref:MAPEG family protein n=1 Tax=Roseobacter sinensis TaxID=2931391 RepID=A0ABT3BA27_9RHOB|nr:MAPEG family protein [Roseobacter sp. WL0113]MCV3270432.1 MAPEG family protein [Roseobacter sp. WL0113]
MEISALPAELSVVIWLALFAASLWIPYIVGVNMHPQQGVDDFARPPPLVGFPEWVHRAHRAHLNLLEQLVPFAVLVLVVDRLDGFSALTQWTAIIFLCLRVAHAIGMISGLARFPLRPILFTGGWLCCLVMGYAAYTA